MRSITPEKVQGAESSLIKSPKDLGQRLRAHRKSLGLTLQEVSDTSLLGLRFLSELERGKENASLGKTLRAAQALGMEVLVLSRQDVAKVIRLLNQADHQP